MASGRLIQSKFAALRIYKFALKFGFLAKFFCAKFMLGFVGAANLIALLASVFGHFDEKQGLKCPQIRHLHCLARL